MMSTRLLPLGRDERGAAIIELALIAPFFALMTVGIVDMSNAFSRKLALEQGAQRAIEKVMQTTQDSTVEGTLTTEAVCQVNGTNADGSCKTSPISASNVTVTWRRECTSSSGTLTQAPGSPYSTSAAFDSSSNACPSGTAKEAEYIQVKVTDKYTPMFPIHFAKFNTSDGAYDLSATAGVRTK
jgi:Flp pilus assembly protein TadG